MLNIPEEIKKLFKEDNISNLTRKKFKLAFYDDTVDSLYPYETLYPDMSLYPSEHGMPWLVIENSKIENNSLSITEALSETDNLEFGSCESSVLEVIVADVIENIVGKEFTLTVEISGYEIILGMYTVTSFTRQADRRKRKIIAYDRMRWFNTDVSTWYNSLHFPMTLKSFRNSLCEYIGIQQEEVELIFDSLQLTKTIEPQQLLGIDVLRAICQINGCFGHVDKTGKLKYIHLQQTGLYPEEGLFPHDELYPSEFGGDGMDTEIVSTYKKNITYEDYIIEGITGLVIRGQEGDIGANTGDNYNAYVIEGNFLVYGKSASELLNIAQALLPIIYGRTYRPAKLECNAMPWLEVGDAIIIPTRNDVVETFLMKRVLKCSQAMMDTIQSTGTQKKETVFGINKQIIQLEGKTALIVKTVEEVSAKVSDVEKNTEAQLKVVSDAITAEVTRAQGKENELSASIKVMAGQIEQKVSQGDLIAKFNMEVNKDGSVITMEAGHFVFKGKNFWVNADGSGGAANGNFTWDTSGKIKISMATIDGATNTGTMGADMIHCNKLNVEAINVGNSVEANYVTCNYISCPRIDSIEQNIMDLWDAVNSI